MKLNLLIKKVYLGENSRFFLANMLVSWASVVQGKLSMPLCCYAQTLKWQLAKRSLLPKQQISPVMWNGCAVGDVTPTAHHWLEKLFSTKSGSLTNLIQ